MTKKIVKTKAEKVPAVQLPIKKAKKNDKLKEKIVEKEVKNKVEKKKVLQKKLKLVKKEVKEVEKKLEIKEEKKKDIKEEKKKVIKEEKKKVIKEEKKKDIKLNKNKSGVLKCTKEHVSKCVEALLMIDSTKNQEEKSLLNQISKNSVFLQITAVKIPKTPRRTVRIYLPHSLVAEDDEVALFVPDLVKGIRQDYEKSVEHYETLLRDHKVTRIKEVIPMNRVKTEYRQFESKLKLARLFDFYLVDGKITGHLTHLLGSNFHKIARKPIPIKLSRDNLKSEIDNALKKANLDINPNGNTHIVEVALTTMKSSDIVDNVLAAFKEIKKSYPGGLTNIKSLLIKTKNSKSIPVYYSMVNKNKVEVPEIKPLRPKTSAVPAEI